MFTCLWAVYLCSGMHDLSDTAYMTVHFFWQTTATEQPNSKTPTLANEEFVTTAKLTLI